MSNYNFLETEATPNKTYTRAIHKSGDVIKIDKSSFVIICDLSLDEYPLTKNGNSVSVSSSHGTDHIDGSHLNLSFNLTSKLPS